MKTSTHKKLIPSWTFNPRTPKEEARGSEFEVNLPCLEIEFQDTYGQILFKKTKIINNDSNKEIKPTQLKKTKPCA